MVDDAWVARVVSLCEPVLATAGVGFVLSQAGADAILWEAEPLAFAARYPEIVASYGDQWPAPCVDFWIYLEADRARLAHELSGPEPVIALSGDADVDGHAIAAAYAEILGVAPVD